MGADAGSSFQKVGIDGGRTEEKSEFACQTGRKVGIKFRCVLLFRIHSFQDCGSGNRTSHSLRPREFSSRPRISKVKPRIWFAPCSLARSKKQFEFSTEVCFTAARKPLTYLLVMCMHISCILFVNSELLLWKHVKGTR